MKENNNDWINVIYDPAQGGLIIPSEERSEVDLSHIFSGVRLLALLDVNIRSKPVEVLMKEKLIKMRDNASENSDNETFLELQTLIDKLPDEG